MLSWKTPFLLLPAFVWLAKAILDTRFADNDLFARMAVGQLIHRSGTVPLQDPFAFTLTKPIWFDHEWLSGLLFYYANLVGGDVGLLVCNLLFLAATGFLLYSAQRSSAEDSEITRFVRIAWLFLLLIPSLGVWIKVVRARVFTFALLAVLYWVFSQWRQGKRGWCLAFIPPLAFVIWANSHGGFVVGLGLFGIFTALSLFDAWRGESVVPVREVLLSAIASCLAPMVNPYGLGYLEFIFQAVTKDRALIVEWAPVPLFSAEFFQSGHVTVLVVLAILLLGMIRQKQLLSWEVLLFLAVTLFYGLRHQRLVPLFYVTAAVYGVDYFSAALRPPERFKHLFRPEALTGAFRVLTVAAVLWGAVLAGKLAYALPGQKLDYSSYPVAAMDWLKKEGRSGRMLAPFNQASYVLWVGYPEFRVAIDGRYEEVYPDSTIEEGLAALDPSHPKHGESLAAINPDYILLWRGHRGQSAKVQDFGAPWREVYADTNCAILGRS